MIFDRHANLTYKYGNRKFWCRGFYVDTVRRNQKRIEEYLRNQLQEDVIADQLSLFEEYDPFTGDRPVAEAFSRRASHPFSRVVQNEDKHRF